MEIFIQGGPVMYPLLLCSVITGAIIIERSLFWMRLRNTVQPDHISRLCRQMIHERESLSPETNADVVARVLYKGVTSSRAEASLEMQQAATREMDSMLQYLGVLSTMVSLAPLLGIFGTVLGIIESFNVLGDMSNLDPVAATGGLAQALVTTAFGLAIAMPSLIAYKIFYNKASKLQHQIVTGCTQLEVCLGLAEPAG